jgi:hypothetical protein
VTPRLLRAENLTAGYGKMPILHEVTLAVSTAPVPVKRLYAGGQTEYSP